MQRCVVSIASKSIAIYEHTEQISAVPIHIHIATQRASELLWGGKAQKEPFQRTNFEEVRAQSHGILEIAIFCNRSFVSEALSSTMFSYSSSLI